MSISLLTYPLSSQNQRVTLYQVPGDEEIGVYSTNDLSTRDELDRLIYAAYRQIFNEQQILVSNRQKNLETQLRAKTISVKDFIRGLAKSEVFRLRNYNSNNNYRFVEMCIERILGRKVYNKKESIAWSIVLATKGLNGFVDQLLDTPEYNENFGEHTVPYQRRRIIPQHSIGELPFARTPRYDSYHRQQLEKMGYFQGQPPYVILPALQGIYPTAVKVAGVFALILASALGLGILAVFLSFIGIISL